MAEWYEEFPDIEFMKFKKNLIYCGDSWGNIHVYDIK